MQEISHMAWLYTPVQHWFDFMDNNSANNKYVYGAHECQRERFENK